jgi:hypothetical protein
LLAALGTRDHSAAAFASMFSTIQGGKLIDFSDAERATSEIINSIAQNGLSAWLDDVPKIVRFEDCS